MPLRKPEQIVELVRMRLVTVREYTFVTMSYGCECHGYDSRFWTTLCVN